MPSSLLFFYFHLPLLFLVILIILLFTCHAYFYHFVFVVVILLPSHFSHLFCFFSLQIFLLQSVLLHSSSSSFFKHFPTQIILSPLAFIITLYLFSAPLHFFLSPHPSKSPSCSNLYISPSSSLTCNLFLACLVILLVISLTSLTLSTASSLVHYPPLLSLTPPLCKLLASNLANPANPSTFYFFLSYLPCLHRSSPHFPPLFLDTTSSAIPLCLYHHTHTHTRTRTHTTAHTLVPHCYITLRSHTSSILHFYNCFFVYISAAPILSLHSPPSVFLSFSCPSSFLSSPAPSLHYAPPPLHTTALGCTPPSTAPSSASPTSNRTSDWRATTTSRKARRPPRARPMVSQVYAKTKLSPPRNTNTLLPMEPSQNPQKCMKLRINKCKTVMFSCLFVSPSNNYDSRLQKLLHI